MPHNPFTFGLGFGFGILAFFVLLALFTIAAFAFWLWMLIDCAQAPERPGSNDRVIWILVLVFTHWLGALIYYFTARRPRLAATRASGLPPTDFYGTPPPMPRHYKMPTNPSPIPRSPNPTPTDQGC